MKRREFMLMLGASALCVGFEPQEAVAGNSSTYKLGDTPVTLNEYASGGGTRVYFAPHSNETTAVAAAKAAVRAYGGRVYWLTHGDGQRNISFKIGGKKYSVDPNRIFSDAGARASLKPYSKEALAAVRGLAVFIIRQVFTGGVRPLVGIHNNTEGGSKSNLSVIAYGPGGGYSEAAQKVYQNPKRDPDDFFFVTKPDYFERLKSKGFNVVLQSGGVADDGSLSVYCQRDHVPYVNEEAQLGHSSQQKEMFKVLASIT